MHNYSTVDAYMYQYTVILTINNKGCYLTKIFELFDSSKLHPSIETSTKYQFSFLFFTSGAIPARESGKRTLMESYASETLASTHTLVPSVPRILITAFSHGGRPFASKTMSDPRVYPPFGAGGTPSVT